MPPAAKNLAEALEWVQSEAASTRKSGLAEMQRLLKLYQNSAEFGKIRENSLHALFEGLFRAVTREKTVYSKSTKSRQQENSESRLSACADALRCAVEASLQRIRLKTLNALVSHFQQALPGPESNLFEPLADSYLKSLSVILSYAPHVEHLTHSRWADLVDLILGVVKTLTNEISQVNGTLRGSFHPGTHESLGSRFSQYRATSTRPSKSRNSILFQCLNCLVSATNQSLADKGRDIIDTAITYLSATPATSSIDALDAFAVLSKCLGRTSIEFVGATKRQLSSMIPVISSRWSQKTPELRDEMLKVLIHLEPHLMNSVQTGSFEGYSSILENLLEEFQNDYINSDTRPRRFHLTLEDLSLGMLFRNQKRFQPMQSGTIALGKCTIQTEHNWTILYFISTLLWSLEHLRSKGPTLERTGSQSTPRKRRRLGKTIDEALRKSTNASETTDGRVRWLQVLALLTNTHVLSEKLISTLLTQLTSVASSSSYPIASWTLVAIAGCAAQPESSASALSDQWASLWSLSFKLMSSAAHSRAACHLLCTLLSSGLIGRSDASDSSELLVTGGGVNHPAVLCDSTIAFWLMFETYLNRNSAGGSSMKCHQDMIWWITNRWTPSNFENRTYAVQCSRTLPVKALSWALFSGHNLGREHSICIPNLDILGITWLDQYRSWDVLGYLVLSLPEKLKATDGARIASVPAPPLTNIRPEFRNAIITMLSSELDKIVDTWESDTDSRLKKMTPESFQLCFSLALMSDCASNHPATKSVASGRISQKADVLRDFLMQYIASDVGKDSLGVAMESIVPLLTPSLSSYPKDSTSDMLCPSRKMLSQLLHVVQQVDQDSLESTGRDEMDIDEIEQEINNNDSQTPKDVSDICLRLRRNVEVLSSTTNFINRARTIIVYKNTQNDPAAEQNALKISKNFVKYLLSAPPADLFGSRLLLEHLEDAGYHLAIDDAESLLVCLGSDDIMGSYEYRRCEVLFATVIQLLKMNVSSWTDRRNLSISNVADQMYVWLLDNLEAHVCSPFTQMKLSELFFTLIKYKNDYQPAEQKPSMRTMALKLLKQGEAVVQYHIANQLSDLFGAFVTSQHDLIFEDVHKSLAMNSEWIEGMAMRLLILALLASKWSSLRRRCIYHIFETAALVPSTVPYAKRCVELISNNLDFDSQQKVFSLFRSQIIFTWFNEKDLSAIPWSIFGFADLTDLVHESQEEIVAQGFMRGLNERLDEAQQLLRASREDLLIGSIARTAAYCFLNDVCTTLPEGRSSHTSENLMIDVLGKPKFVNLLQKQSSTILGHMLMRLEHEETFEKAFIRRKGYDASAKALRQLKNIDGSEETLPMTQQPSFKAKYLLDGIERLCRRVTKESGKLWTPFSITTVIRMLLNDLRPALGHFHIRRTLRRMCILLSLAGDTALKGYPLELLLHSLRPYLNDNLSAHDTIGIYKYLLDKGREYLSSVPSFVAGTLLAIYLGLRRLLQSTQDSTTQESQHLAMLSSAQSFQKWLNEWIEQYDSRKISSSLLKTFQTLLQSVRLISGPGSASLNATYESELLKALLDDMQSRKRILQPRLAELCLRQLCNGFVLPESFHDDVCGLDEDATKFSVPIWASNRWNGLDRNYVLWSSRVLGRSFRYQGMISPAVVPETGFAAMKTSSSSSSDLLPSKTAIIRYFIATIQSENSTEVAIAERTLQRMLSALVREQGDINMEQVIPEPLRVALQPNVHSERIGSENVATMLSLDDAFFALKENPFELWARHMDLALLRSMSNHPVLNSIIPAIEYGEGEISSQLYPYILHCALEDAYHSDTTLSQHVSKCLSQSLDSFAPDKSRHFRLLVNSTLYLLSQPFPGETTRLDRYRWLNIDLQQLAQIAVKCKMFKSALYLTELAQSLEHHRPLFNPASFVESHANLLLSIFREVEEPDAFHGVVQTPDLNSIADRLAFEGNGTQEVLIRGAQSDSQMRLRQDGERYVFGHVVNSLARLNMSSLTYSLGLGQSFASADDSTTESITKAALKLRQWDLSIPGASESHLNSVYQTFQTIQDSTDLITIKNQLELESINTMERAKKLQSSWRSLKTSFASLVAFAEADEILSIRSKSDVDDVSKRLLVRQGWIDNARLEDLEIVLTSRETLFGIISDSNYLQRLLGLSRKSALLQEAKVHIQSSQSLRSFGSFEQALNNVAYLSDIAPSCKDSGLNIDGAVKKELANVLWDRGELAPSIRVLKDLIDHEDFDSQSLPIGKAGLLATLGHRISEARMEKPDEILNHYLAKAQKALKRQSEGQEAGRVFHEYAAYCHAQLTNSDFENEFKRTQSFKDKRLADIQELESLLKTPLTDDQKARVKSDRNKARKWYEIDRAEFDRLSKSREQFLRQSLENYILSLAASNEHDTDMLRFVALWLEHANNSTANDAVSGHFHRVPMHKFAPLMNQLASRLQDEDSAFQQTMLQLVEQICTEHPYHAMYHIYAGCNTKGGNDPTAKSRNAATKKVASRLQNKQETSRLWTNVHKANDLYIKLACVRSDAFKAGVKIALRKVSASKYIERDIPGLSVPPITLSIPLRQDGNYSEVPTVEGFKPEMSIASGLSAPKILTAVASDGSQYKQLFKAGLDDLRQDAIMEQVFEVVSSLLQTTRETRKRNLRIRTYKVIPLDATSGAIEFVQNTIPLTDFLRPAHQCYHPKDLKWDMCRTRVDEARQRSLESRVRVYKEITERFHPVLRHFFFERFEDPDDWFHRRLAYTRSTASISILGHALGLGDRHCQNILLDAVTGEVVHIDLGVAFEGGRVLAVPEVVPFRLTRDIVDGMGIMGVEGVFRRCCEFTLEALRNNRDAIMTLLNVLRYDPLYSWSMSPLRAKRLQEEQQEKEASQQQEGKTTRRSAGSQHLVTRRRSGEDEFDEKDRDGGEADRALSVVEKKLGAGLSVMATVNELIQQATDERNLAVLFCGWAAYA